MIGCVIKLLVCASINDYIDDTFDFDWLQKISDDTKKIYSQNKQPNKQTQTTTKHNHTHTTNKQTNKFQLIWEERN